MFHLSSTLAQDSLNPKIEISNIILNDKNLKKFIEENFQYINMNKVEKIQAKHPLLLLNFNRSQKHKDNHFALFGMDINDIYIFENGHSKYCTFLIMEIPNNDFRKFVENLGYPENISKEDYENREYDFLYWNYSGFEIFINKNHSSENKKNYYIIQALNMPYKEIMDFSKIK